MSHSLTTYGNIFSSGRGGMTATTIISESRLYKMVMRSDKLQAKAFQDWVTREVLPTIRKTGTYSVNDMPVLAETVAAPVRPLKSAFGIALNVLSEA